MQWKGVLDLIISQRKGASYKEYLSNKTRIIDIISNNKIILRVQAPADRHPQDLYFMTIQTLAKSGLQQLENLFSERPDPGLGTNFTVGQA